MSVLCDHIEKFIIDLLDEQQGEAELRRSELADRFGCAPSQISYVLSTRFSPVRGYVTTSRRGGGGYIRILRVQRSATSCITDIVEGELKTPVSMRRAEELVRGLAHSGAVSSSSVPIMLAAISPHALKSAGDAEDALRSSVLRQMLVQCMGACPSSTTGR